MDIVKLYNEIKQFSETQLNHHLLTPDELIKSDQFRDFILAKIALAPDMFRDRLEAEFFGLGPIASILEDQNITEILINGPSSIWYEIKGQLYKHDDQFFCEVSYNNVIERLSQKMGKHISLNQPIAEGHIDKSRLTIVDSSVTNKNTIISIRKHPAIPWTLQKLHQNNWCNKSDLQILNTILKSKQNFLIIGETGSGKTSIANAFLQDMETNERALIIEDSSELQLPNDCSVKLLTREDPFQQLRPIDQQELLKRALRLRPDRLVMGEIRSVEAKDFLMLLATGHKGCFATLHASNAQEGLIRLEMLIQLGAPQWSLQAIRRLIFLSLNFIIVTDRDSQGRRLLKGIYKLSSLEDSGLTLDSVDSFTREATSSDFGA